MLRGGSAAAVARDVDMQILSAAFEDAGDIPRRFTCDGDNISPPLRWSDPPPSVKSFAILLSDPDAPGGVFRHWAAYDIAAAQHSLPEAAAAVGPGMRQAVNDFRRRGYGGPCPPHGHGAHQYRFTLLALDTPSLELDERASCADVERAARRHVLAEANLTGFYQR
jgi:Raf kinase inhibitor-like YbhB/YbcL family protein